MRGPRREDWKYKRTASSAEGALSGEKFVNNKGIGLRRTMIRGGLMDEAEDCACVADRPAKLKEVTYELVRVIGEMLTPCGDVKVRRNGET